MAFKHEPSTTCPAGDISTLPHIHSILIQTLTSLIELINQLVVGLFKPAPSLSIHSPSALDYITRVMDSEIQLITRRTAFTTECHLLETEELTRQLIWQWLDFHRSVWNLAPLLPPHVPLPSLIFHPPAPISNLAHTHVNQTDQIINLHHLMKWLLHLIIIIIIILFGFILGHFCSIIANHKIKPTNRMIPIQTQIQTLQVEARVETLTEQLKRFEIGTTWSCFPIWTPISNLEPTVSKQNRSFLLSLSICLLGLPSFSGPWTFK